MKGPLQDSGNDQVERIRAKLYDFVSSNPSDPRAEQARRILGKLPKVRTSAKDMEEALRLAGDRLPSEGTSAEEFGFEPPTADEQAGIADAGRLAKPGLGARAATAVSPSTTREYLRGVDRSVTGGVLRQTARAIGKRMGRDMDTREQEDRHLSPNAGMLGDITGALFPYGLVGGVTRKIMTPLSALAGRATTTIAGRAATGAVAGAVGNELAAPLIAGTQSAIAGENPLPEMARAVTSPATAITGAMVGAPAGLAAGIRRSPSQVGRDIRIVEEYGSTPTPFGGAKGGIFETPLLKDVGSSSRETGVIASKAAKNVVGGIDAEEKAIQNEYRQAVGNADDLGQLEGRVRPDAVLDAANRMMGSMRLTKAQRADIQGEVIDILNQHPNGLTVQGMNEFKQKLQEMSGGEGPLVELGKAAKGAIDETEMGPINLKYHEGMEGLRRKRGLLNIKDTTEPRLAEDRVARHILNRGENVGGAGIQEPDVEAFIAENPGYKTMFDAVSAMNARGRMGLSLMPEGGGLLHRVGNILGHNIEPVAVGAYRLGAPLEDKGIAAALAARYLLGMHGDTE